MTHTHQAFIRKNTFELRNKLEKLGYKKHELSSVHVPNQPYLVTNIGHDESYYSSCYTNFPALSKDYIDCENNENLFLAIAALRDDTDKYQWFTDDNIWELNNDDLPSRYMQLEGHKATIDELINYFKN